MKNLFYKLSQLQAFGYGVAHCEAIAKFDKNLGKIDIEFYERRKEELNKQILDLQKEIIDMVNNLNGEKVY